VTDEVQQALRKAGMALSRYNVDRLIINRFDDTYLASNINAPRAVDSIKQAIHSGITRYRVRVLEVIDRFKGYTHVAIVGGGAGLLADDIRTHVNLREDRFFVAQDPQFARGSRFKSYWLTEVVMNRRKVLIYLRPETHASERFADTRIEAHHRGDRGELSRTALLAGIALGEIDRRLPSVLAALLADNTSQETLRTILSCHRF